MNTDITPLCVKVRVKPSLWIYRQGGMLFEAARQEAFKKNPVKNREDRQRVGRN
jgi:hypothetical protein